MISETKSHSPNRNTKTIVTRRTKSHSPSSSRKKSHSRSVRKSRGSRRSKKRGVPSKPMGLTSRLKIIKATGIVPENELTTGEEYFIKTSKRKYRGVLGKLKDERGCYVFKYLERIKKNEIMAFIHPMDWNNDGDTFVKVYDNTKGEKILSVEDLKEILSIEDLKGMEETSRVVIGQTYYVRFVRMDDEKTDKEYNGHGSFRGTYLGEIDNEDSNNYGHHAFSNIVEINTEVCENLTFYYTAEAAIQKNRQTRVFSKLIPGFHDPTRF
jgi:hypothetical protein